MAHYCQTDARETWCEVCGELVLCEVFTAEYPEQETGYTDERAICADCRPEYARSMKPESCRSACCRTSRMPTHEKLEANAEHLRA